MKQVVKEKVRYCFSGHETFSCRSYWPKKGYDFLNNGNKFNDKDGVIRYYTSMFDNLPTKNKINNSSVFELGGRSYTQSPLSRLKFIIYNYLEF